MARAIAGGTISFGMVSIPVKLYPATQPTAGLSFNLLHKACGTRLKQQYICPHEGNAIVPREDMVKGYEFAKDQYVTFTAEELKSLEEKSTQAIEIAAFIPLASVDPVYFDKPYYLAPEKGGEKAYKLLTETMRESGRAALARYAARGKQYLVLLRPAPGAQGGNGIVMQQLLYADEVRPFSEVPIADADLKEQELKLARQLVDQIASETFDPGAYEDDVRKRIQADIERKIAGQEIATAPEEAAPAQIIDLMEALKQSLGKGGGDKGATAGPARDERHPARRAAAGKADRRGAKSSKG